MIDIDKFKQFNDTHGHPIGDQVLIAVSTTIAKRAQGKGKAYRYGGEEIAILLPNYSKVEASALAETIRVELERARRTEKNLVVTASFGVGALPEDAQGGEELVQLSDDALRSAKQLGRNLVRAVGDADEVKQSSTPRRKQPAPGLSAEDALNDVSPKLFLGYSENDAAEFLTHTGLYVRNSGKSMAFTVNLLAEKINGVGLHFEGLPIQRIDTKHRYPMDVRAGKEKNGTFYPTGGTLGGQLDSLFDHLVEENQDESFPVTIKYKDYDGKQFVTRWVIKRKGFPDKKIWCELDHS